LKIIVDGKLKSLPTGVAKHSRPLRNSCWRHPNPPHQWLLCLKCLILTLAWHGCRTLKTLKANSGKIFQCVVSAAVPVPISARPAIALTSRMKEIPIAASEEKTGIAALLPSSRCTLRAITPVRPNLLGGASASCTNSTISLESLTLTVAADVADAHANAQLTWVLLKRYKKYRLYIRNSKHPKRAK
jgi:hypothetical protein